MKTAKELLGLELHQVPQRVWEYFDKEVVPVVRDVRVARTVFPVVPLPSRAVKRVAWDERKRRGRALIDMSGEGWARDDVVKTEKTLVAPVLHAECSVGFRDVDAESGDILTLDRENIEEAGLEVQDAEEELVLKGDSALGIDGVDDLTASPANSVDEGGWATAGNFWKAMQAMESEFNQDGIPLRGAHLFAHPTDIKNARGQRANVKEDPLADAVASGFLSGFTGTPKMASGTPFVVVPQRAYMHMLIGQELTINRLADEKLNPVYMVWEIATVRFKRKEAVCKIDATA